MTFLPFIAGRVFDTPLLIARVKLDTILGVLAPRLRGENLPFGAKPVARDYEVTSGVAIIPIVGTLVRRTVGLEAQSGLMSYGAIADRLDAALQDSAVKSILLDIDSPGGEAGGVFDLADKIFAARKIKPIWAIVNDEAFSAAYAIAAATDKIYLSRTGGVGSIGVIAVHLDQSVAEADAGLKYTAIYAGEHKNDFSPHEPLSDPARAQLQTEVDQDILKRFGGVGAVADAMTELHGVPKIPALQAKRGDICLIDIGRGETLGVCAGDRIICPGLRGLVAYPLLQGIRAWEIG